MLRYDACWLIIYYRRLGEVHCLIFWLANSAEDGDTNPVRDVCNNITSQQDVLCTNTLTKFDANITWKYDTGFYGRIFR